MLSHEEFRNTRKRLALKKGTKKPINLNDIVVFEKNHNIKIPEQYREFLLENNGSEPVINEIELKLNDGNRDNAFWIRFLISLQESEVGDSDEQLDESGFNVKPPKGFMNIAHLDGDHPELFICVEQGENYGKIFFCEDRDKDSLEIIRKDFNELIDNVFPWHDYEFEECCDCGDIERARYLIKNGYKYPPNIDKTLITDVLESDYDMSEILELLIEKETDIESLNGLITNVGLNLKLLETLINKGININGTDSEGNTALIKSVRSKNIIINNKEEENRIQVIKFLLGCGISINQKNNKGLDVFDSINFEKERFKRYPSRLEVIKIIENIIKNKAVV